MNSETYFFCMYGISDINNVFGDDRRSLHRGITEGCHVAMTTKIGVPVLSGNPTHFKGSPLTTRKPRCSRPF